MISASQTITSAFKTTVYEFAGKTAFVFIDRRFSYREYDELSNRIANALIAKGIQPGDRVAINLPNLPQYLVFMMGAIKAGCIISGLSPLASESEIAWQLEDLGAAALISFDELYAQKVQRLIPSLPTLKLAVITRPLDLMPAPIRFITRLLRKLPFPEIRFSDPREVLFNDFLKSGSRGEVHVAQQPTDIAAIQYTGGTTGVPKGAMLSHENLLSNTQQSILVTAPKIGAETGLSIFPFFHIAGLTAALNTIVIAGAWLLIPNPRDLTFIIRQLKKYRPSLIFAVPLLYERLLSKPEFTKIKFNFLKFAMSGAAPMSDSLKRSLEEFFHVPVLEGYGMTEASPGITINYPGRIKPGSVGQALPETQLKVVEIDGDAEVASGSEGELIVAGPQVMQGYWNNAAETGIALRSRQGRRWLFTGDVARIDAEGYVTLVDRLKDMVNVGGFKVFSMEVEAVVSTHPAVYKCAILAETSPLESNEIVRLIVQLKPDEPRSYEDLRKKLEVFCRDNLAAYKRPRIIQFVESIPLTPIGKVDKKMLRRVLETGAMEMR